MEYARGILGANQHLQISQKLMDSGLEDIPVDLGPVYT